MCFVCYKLLLSTSCGPSWTISIEVSGEAVLCYEPLHHNVELLGLVLHDHVASEWNKLEIRLGNRSFHLAHFHQGHEDVFHAIHKQGGNRNLSMVGRVSCKNKYCQKDGF